jgi:lipoprotein-anchoring transpeptidase ErfK/SrfK
MIKQAQQAWQAGERPTAVRLLKQALRDDPHNHEAWLLAAEFAPTPAARSECLARAAKFAPAVPVAAPVSPPAPDTLAALRQKAHRTAVAAPSPPVAKPRHWLWAGVGVMALLVIVAVGWVAIGLPQPETPAIAAVSSPTPTGEATTEAPPTAVPSPSPTQPAATATPTPNPIQPKQVASLSMGGGSNTAADPRATWTATPSPTPTNTPSPTPQPTYVAESVNFRWPAVGENERWIQVNLTAQQLNAYEGRTVVFSTPISSGLPQWATVTGQFRIYYRLPTQTMDGRRLGFDYVTENVPHVQYFYKDFALHGAYWHNNFGQPMSHGCVNLSVADAEWLYSWATYGTLVYVHY